MRYPSINMGSYEIVNSVPGARLISVRGPVADILLAGWGENRLCVYGVRRGTLTLNSAHLVYRGGFFIADMHIVRILNPPDLSSELSPTSREELYQVVNYHGSIGDTSAFVGLLHCKVDLVPALDEVSELAKKMNLQGREDLKKRFSEKHTPKEVEEMLSTLYEEDRISPQPNIISPQPNIFYKFLRRLIH